MARLARVVAVDVAHHVTQRANGRQYILNCDAERLVYLDLLSQAAQLYSLTLMGYCLMSNHVHLVVIPHKADSLARTMKQTHGRYASYWNAGHASSGHAWQGRFYSCPLEEGHLWEALRYAELNPVRAGMVASAELWPWSSAGAHCGTAEPASFLEMEFWRRHWSPERWREFLNVGETEAALEALRQSTHTGRPLGSKEFVKSLEQATQRKLAPGKGGRRPANAEIDKRQTELGFDD